MSRKAMSEKVLTSSSCRPKKRFSRFRDEIIDEFRALAPPDCEVRTQKYPKNNSIYTGISFVPKHLPGHNEDDCCLIAPVYYVEDLFEAYMGGNITVNGIASAVIDQYRRLRVPSVPTLNALYDPDISLGRICMRIVRTDSNQAMLEDLPSVSLLDLSIIFFYVGIVEERGFAGCLVNNSLMQSWNTDVRGLLKAALGNAPGLLPPVIRTIGDAVDGKENPNAGFFTADTPLLKTVQNPSEESHGPDIYILSNTSGAQGSAVIFYKDVLRKCAAAIGGDLFVLPCSVHELLLIRADPLIKPGVLAEMVRQINLNEVSERDRLSDSVYRYYAATDELGYADRDERVSLRMIYEDI